MHRAAAFLFLLGGLSAPAGAPAQQSVGRIVDRIVARVEGDILLLSELRELGQFQQLLEGKTEDDAKLLDRLIEQWVVGTEAEASHFPRPAAEDVDHELALVGNNFSSSEAQQQRMKELGLTAAALRRQVERQLFLLRYLDYKFRPAVQIEPAAIEKYYREELVPQLAARSQPAPTLEAVSSEIRELLVQRGITEHAERWLEESKSRLRIEKEPK